MNTSLRNGGILLVTLLVVVSMAAPALAASPLNHTDGDAPNPEFDVGTVTIDSWDNENFSSPLEYYDDSGDAAKLNGELNRSSDVADLGTGIVNPISLTATDINVAEFGEFPRKSESENSASALDASEWTASGATVSDVNTAPNVAAVEYAGTASSDSATYGNFSITADAEKRYLQLAADLTSASGTPTLQLNDSDGDYVVVEVYNSSANQNESNVLANSTGEGHVTQVQVGSLAVKGSGDGAMGEIQDVHIQGDVNADFSLINVERTSPYTFGEKYVDTDSDDELETETIREPHGSYSVHSVSTLGQTFDNAIIKGLSYPAHISAEYAPSEDVDATFKSDNAYPQWDTIADIYYRLTLPDAYDVSYSNVELEQTSQWPGTRYVTVEVAEDVGDTAFEDIDSWTGLTSSFDTQDKTVSLDSTVSPGTEYAIHVELKLTGDEASAMQAMSGGAGVMADGGGGGFWASLFSLPGMLIGGIVGGLGLRRLGVF